MNETALWGYLAAWLGAGLGTLAGALPAECFIAGCFLGFCLVGVHGRVTRWNSVSTIVVTASIAGSLPPFFGMAMGLPREAYLFVAVFSAIAWPFMTAVPGTTIAYDLVAERITDLCAEYNIKAIAYDRWRMDVFKKALDGIELPLVDWGQGFKDSTVGIEALEEAILNDRFKHDNNPVLNMSVHNGRVVSDPANNRKFEKSKATGRIDPLVALAMAMGIASRDAIEAPIDLDNYLENIIIA